MNDDWRENPGLEQVDKEKLDMLQKLAEQGKGKNASEMLPFLMNAASRGKNNGLKFSADEISVILTALKSGKSSAEAAKIDQIVNLMHMIR
nr:hypothetical protein [uncultured Blautia sp.]